MAIAIDIRDCAPRRRGLGRSFEGSRVATIAGSASSEGCGAGAQSTRGMPRIQQVRRVRRQEATRIARNVRALFEWSFAASTDAASLLGRWAPFRGKLEEVGVGKNIFGTRGLW